MHVPQNYWNKLHCATLKGRSNYTYILRKYFNYYYLILSVAAAYIGYMREIKMSWFQRNYWM